MCRTVISDIDGVYTLIDDGLVDLTKLWCNENDSTIYLSSSSITRSTKRYVFKLRNNPKKDMKSSRMRPRLVGVHSTNHILPYTNSFFEGIMTWVRIRLKQNMTIRVVVVWLKKMVQPLIYYKTSYTRLIATRVSILQEAKAAELLHNKAHIPT
jgi:hypothetical protein